jgi:hypothetical protein
VGDKTGAYRIFVVRPQRKSSPERPERRWEDNIKTKSSVSRMWAWTELVWFRIRNRCQELVNAIMHFGFHKFRKMLLRKNSTSRS